jgi:hypothetical protein
MKAKRTNKIVRKRALKRNKKEIRSTAKSVIYGEVYKNFFDKNDPDLLKSIMTHLQAKVPASETGLEPEVESIDMDDSGEISLLDKSYDPSTIRVAFRQYPVDLLIKRIKENAINFTPGFQRASNIWNARAQSRLIESILIKIPLPVFYMDTSNEDHWDVIDGIQRLTAFKHFAADKVLKLRDLEFMPELNGKGYDELPRNLQRRFLESYISLYLIEKGTPKRVKQSIYERINTGGTTLVAQEIRQAIFQGSVTEHLDAMVSLESFKRATDNGVSSLRMADKECATRFIAFFLTDYKQYRIKDMDKFLSDALEKLSNMALWDQDGVLERFDLSMKLSFELFGKQSFRRNITNAKVNKALFETLSSTLAKLTTREADLLISKKKVLKSRYIKIQSDPEFVAAISSGTGEVKKVQKRFKEIENLIRGIIND